MTRKDKMRLDDIIYRIRVTEECNEDGIISELRALQFRAMADSISDFTDAWDRFTDKHNVTHNEEVFLLYLCFRGWDSGEYYGE